MKRDMRARCSCVGGSLAATAVSRRADWPMWGGTPSRNMVSPMKGLPTSGTSRSGKNVKWVAELGSQSYGNPVVGGGVVLDRHQQRGGARSEAGRRSRRAHGVPRGDRRVHVAGDASRSCRPAAPTTGRSRASPRRRWSSTASPISCRTAARSWPPTSMAFTTRERRPVQGREADRPQRPRRPLDVRHDGGGRRLPAQPGELVAGRRTRT